MKTADVDHAAELALTIVGAQPRRQAVRRDSPGQAPPRGLADVLRRAALDPLFRQRLMADRGAIEELGLVLRTSERAMLAAAAPATLAAMIDQIELLAQEKPR